MLFYTIRIAIEVKYRNFHVITIIIIKYVFIIIIFNVFRYMHKTKTKLCELPKVGASPKFTPTVNDCQKIIVIQSRHFECS